MAPARQGSGILSEAADEAAWRALVDQGLKGAPWRRLLSKTADGVEIAPLYREPEGQSAADPFGMPGAAPFVRGAREGAWLVRQRFAHPDPAEANREILADLEGGVSSIALAIDPSSAAGVTIRDGADLDLALAEVMLEAAPVALDAGGYGLWAANLLEAKLKGVAAPGTAFNVDPIGALMRTGAMARGDIEQAARFAARVRKTLPAATTLCADARPVHEAGGTEAQEIAAALSAGIAYLRALNEAGLSTEDAGAALSFALAIGPDVLIETAKLRALRLCWARVMHASGAPPRARAAHIQAHTSQRMLTRYDAWTNILRLTTAAFAAGIGGAETVTVSAFTDALGAPTPFARRVARNTQHVLLEECRLAHVADPAGGAWFVEAMTRELAAKAWALMQQLEAKGGIVAALEAGALQLMVSEARAARETAIATRREPITGISDFPLLYAPRPETATAAFSASKPMPPRASADVSAAPLQPMRWAAPFEALRDRAEAISPRPAVFFATLGALSAFGPRAQFARNLFAAGGVASIGEEDERASPESAAAALSASGARVAVIAGTDEAYAQHAQAAARALKAAGAVWVVLAGKPGEAEAGLRAAGVDQFVFAGQNAVAELVTLHAALGIAQ